MILDATRFPLTAEADLVFDLAFRLVDPPGRYEGLSF